MLPSVHLLPAVLACSTVAVQCAHTFSTLCSSAQQVLIEISRDLNGAQMLHKRPHSSNRCSASAVRQLQRYAAAPPRARYRNRPQRHTRSGESTSAPQPLRLNPCERSTGKKPSHAKNRKKAGRPGRYPKWVPRTICVSLVLVVHTSPYHRSRVSDHPLQEYLSLMLHPECN